MHDKITANHTIVSLYFHTTWFFYQATHNSKQRQSNWNRCFCTMAVWSRYLLL